jgi:hypothetical protein
MVLYAATFEVLHFRVLGTHMRIDGPALILDALKAHLKSRNVRCKLKRDLQDGSILLKVRPGQNHKHVRNLLDKWTE